MKTQTLKISSLLVFISLVFSACSGLPGSTQLRVGSDSSGMPVGQVEQQDTSKTSSDIAPQATPSTALSAEQPDLLAAYEQTLENVYTQVSPSVVNIRVVQQQDVSLGSDLGNSPFQLPGNNGSQTPQYSQGLGSGFVWDTVGDIVTNNHVVEAADKIEVTFADGTVLPATLVGADSYSDLAVIKVEPVAGLLQPVTLADSTQVKVGQLAIAIGNPFGLEGTMTVGIVSALGRTLPASSTYQTGPVYSIPDIIQTDAPINPGNSGGVLVDNLGQVMGVTAAIESPVQANAGIGFAIPSALVAKVVPGLIKGGSYEHSYLGISGGTLTPDMANAMNLPENQHGALVASVVPGGPADKAGVRGSDQSVTVDGQEIPVGGDVIIAIDGQPIQNMDDIIAYLSDETVVGQTVTLTLLRDGKETMLDVTLEARPEPTATPEISQQQVPQKKGTVGAWLGILGAELTPSVSQAMGLDQSQQGILIQEVEAGSPADQAGLHGSDQVATIDGQQVKIGGDVITAVDGQQVTSLSALKAILAGLQPGTEVKLSILRDNSSLQIPVTLGERPTNLP
jgi:serine protease Do